MNELIKLTKVNGSNVRTLRAVGIQQEHFESLLIPIILEKIPNLILLQISR